MEKRGEDSFSILSKDELLLIIANLDYNSLIKLRETSENFTHFFYKHSNIVWRMLVERDFPGIIIEQDTQKQYEKLITRDVYALGYGEEFFQSLESEDNLGKVVISLPSENILNQTAIEGALVQLVGYFETGAVYEEESDPNDLRRRLEREVIGKHGKWFFDTPINEVFETLDLKCKFLVWLEQAEDYGIYFATEDIRKFAAGYAAIPLNFEEKFSAYAENVVNWSEVKYLEITDIEDVEDINDDSIDDLFNKTLGELGEIKPLDVRFEFSQLEE